MAPRWACAKLRPGLRVSQKRGLRGRMHPAALSHVCLRQPWHSHCCGAETVPWPLQVPHLWLKPFFSLLRSTSPPLCPEQRYLPDTTQNTWTNLTAAISIYIRPKKPMCTDVNHSVLRHPPRWAPKFHTNLDFYFFFFWLQPAPAWIGCLSKSKSAMNFISLKGIAHKLSSPLTFCMSNFCSFVCSHTRCPETVT